MNALDASSQAKAKIARLITQARRRSLKPPPDLNLVEWADEYRHLPDNSAEGGQWHTDRVEVAREPMLSASNPKVQEITVMSCIQLLKTELMINIAMFYMHQEPSPIMYVAPKKETCEAWSKERLVKSITATPVLKDIFSSNRRGEGNTITQKQYPGGQLSVVSARNPTDLAMRAVRIMLFDETDKYPRNVGAGEGGSGGEGDPIIVAWGRATTYGKRAKKICACSPTVKGKSRIEEEYLKSNQSVYYQKCTHCGESKELSWIDVHIPRDIKTGKFTPQKARILCSFCGVTWSESDRHDSISEGHWVAKKPEITWHHGYKVSSLASPFTSIVTLAREFVDAQGNPEAIKTFYNTRMAETWREIGEHPDWERLYERREDYPTGVIPDGALLITAGLDVHKGYISWETVGWGRKKHSWSIDAGVIKGDISDDHVKEELAAFLDTTYPNSIGVQVPIMKACIDSGYNTNEVYAFCRQYFSDRVVPIKGEDNLKIPVGIATAVDVNVDGKRFTRGVMKWGVGSSVIKEQLYRWFNAKRPTDESLKEGREFPTGYCHFPMYGEEFFKQITGEQYTLRIDNRGFHTYIWEAIRKDNHFLDCRVYARAAAAMLQMDRMSDGDWEVLHASWFSTPDITESVSDKVKPKKQGWIKRK